MVVAESEGKITSNCGLHGSRRKRKFYRRAGFAISLYEKMGFIRIVQFFEGPKRDNGTYYDEDLMVRFNPNLNE